MRESASTNSQISQIYGRFLKKYPELQYQSQQSLNSKNSGASIASGGGGGYNDHNYHHNHHHHHYKSSNNYHNRGHSGKKQSFRNSRNLAGGSGGGGGGGGMPGYMLTNSPKNDFHHFNQANYFVNSPPPINPFNQSAAASNFDLQQQQGGNQFRLN